MAENGNEKVVRERGKPYKVHEDRVKHAEPRMMLSTEGAEGVAWVDRCWSQVGKELKRRRVWVSCRITRYGRRCFQPQKIGIDQDSIKGY